MKLVDAEKLAWNLMLEHGLSDWNFQFDNAFRRAGYCDYRRKTISLSRNYVLINDEKFAKQTMLHEIAHALSPVGVHHGRQWVLKAKSIGCDGLRLVGGDTVSPIGKMYVGECPGCHRITERRRRLDLSCSKCDSVYNPKYKFNWRLK